MNYDDQLLSDDEFQIARQRNVFKFDSLPVLYVDKLQLGGRRAILQFAGEKHIVVVLSPTTQFDIYF